MSNKRKLAIYAAAVVAALAVFSWWAMLSNGSPSEPIAPIPIAALRAAAATTPADQLPQQLRLHQIATLQAPSALVEVGGGFGKTPIAYTAFEARYRGDGGSIFIDASGDRKTASTNAKPENMQFDDKAYRHLLNDMVTARLVLFTHEHRDHVMAVVRNPRIAEVAAHVWLTGAQRPIMLRSAENDAARAIIKQIPAQLGHVIQRVAPGIAVAPMPGHSPGSQLVFVRLQNGQEYLFIGDIGWVMTNVQRVKTRPRLMQWFFFDPPEERSQVLAQLQALHDLSVNEPNLTLIPCHDAQYLAQLVKAGHLHLANDYQ